MIDEVRPRRRDVVEIDQWPGGEGGFNLLLLRCAEIQRAHFEAVKHFQNAGQPTTGVSEEEFLREKEVQEAYLACLSPGCEDPKERLFKNAKHLREALELDEVAWVIGRHAHESTELLVERGLVVRLEAEGEAADEEDDAS